MTFDQKLFALARCGLTLDDRIRASPPGRSDEPDWEDVLVFLAGADRRIPRCDNLWHFDTECVEGDGSYVDIAARMAHMAQGSLLLSDIRDHVDLEGGEGWLRFTCQGESIEIDCEVEGDWVDGKVFGHFVRLLAKCDPGKVFFYYGLSQDFLVGCVTRDQYARLQQLIPAVMPLR